MSGFFLKGLSGLYAQPGKVERQKEELAMMEIFSRNHDAQRKREEEDQAKIDAYNDTISKFSESLLAPDRNRINLKAKMLGKNLQALIKEQGGSVSKAMSAGARAMLSEYKAELLNSEEASTFRENKRVFDLILKAQSEGKGHLINPNDLRRVQQYNENQGGKLKWSGLLNEIEMPNPDDYDLNEPITAEKILLHGNNRLAIAANWIALNPGVGEPTYQDLIAYVNKYHMSPTGKNNTNFQNAIALENLQLSKNRDARDAEMHELDKLQKKANLQKTLIENESIAAQEQAAGVAGAGDEVWTHNLIGASLNKYSDNPLTVSEWDNGAVLKDPFLKQVFSGSENYSVSLRSHNPSEKGTIFDFSTNKDSWWATAWGLAESDYRISNAKKLFPSVDPTQFAVSGMGLDPSNINKENGRIKLKASQEWFWANGVKNSDIGGAGVLLDRYDGEYEVLDIVMAGVGKNAGKDGEAGREFVLTERVKMNGKVDEDWKNKQRKSLGSDAQIMPQAMAVIRNPDTGHSFYVPIQLNNSQVSQNIMQNPSLKSLEVNKAAASLTEMTTQYEHDLGNIKAQNQSVKNVVRFINTDPSLINSMSAEIRSLNYDPSNPSYRKNLAINFYSALGSLNGSQGQDLANEIREYAKQNTFLHIINNAKRSYPGIENDLASMNVTDAQILERLIQATPNATDKQVLTMALQATLNR